MNLPRIITHKNMRPILNAIAREPFFQCGSKMEYDSDAWYNQLVDLEVPTGELCGDFLKTLAIRGVHNMGRVEPLTGSEGFDAQGLEGKVVIRKTLCSALWNLRDLIPPHRGRIVTVEKKQPKDACLF